MSEDKALELRRSIEMHIAPVIGAGFNSERFSKMAAMAWMENPSLAKASQVSVFRELVKAARQGLVPDSKECALVPFKGQAKLMVMVGGLIKLARQSNQILSLGAFLVREDDVFDIWIDSDGQHFKHTPVPFSNKEVVGVYAVAKLKNGETEIETMNMKEVEAVEKSSRAGNSPWRGPFRNEMVKKSVLRRLLKKLPAVAHMDDILRDDNQFHEFAEKRRPEPVSSRLREQMDIPVEAETLETAETVETTKDQRGNK